VTPSEEQAQAAELARRLGQHNVEALLQTPPEVLRWYLEHVVGVTFRCSREWRISHGPKGVPFRIERIEAGSVKVVDLQARRSA